MNRSGVRDYASAEKWLQGSKDKLKRERSLYEGGVRLARDSATEISVVLSWWGFRGKAITYRSDGVTILHPGSAYQSARRIYMEYVKDLTMVVRKGKVVISLPSDGKSVSKVTNCRTCKGVGTKPKPCYGPTNTCYSEDCEQYASTRPMRELLWVLAWDSPEREAIKQQLMEFQHNHPTCTHGQVKAHLCVDDRYDCYRCRTTGKVEYGNKQRGRVWSGNETIGIDANGNYIEV